MDNTSSEIERLLAEAQAAAEEVEQTQAQAKAASIRRRELVRQLFEAGVPRQQIADRLGITRSMVYQILKVQD